MEPTLAPALPTLWPNLHPSVRGSSTPRGVPIVQRILFRLVLDGVDITNPDICWPWPGSLSKPGYGRIGTDPGGDSYTHRIMYRECVGPIPDGHDVEHACHSQDPSCADGDGCLHRRCCNPLDLEAVTHAENMRRRRLDVRGMKCQSGRHDFEPRPDGTRGCRHCYNERMREANRAWRQKQAEAGRPRLLRAGRMPMARLGEGVERDGGTQWPDGRTVYRVFRHGEELGAVEQTYVRGEGNMWGAQRLEGGILVPIPNPGGAKTTAYEALLRSRRAS